MVNSVQLADGLYWAASAAIWTRAATMAFSAAETPTGACGAPAVWATSARIMAPRGRGTAIGLEGDPTADWKVMSAMVPGRAVSPSWQKDATPDSSGAVEPHTSQIAADEPGTATTLSPSAVTTVLL